MRSLFGSALQDLSDNAIVKLCNQFLKVSSDYDGDKFFTAENGVKMATPLLLTLAVVELSDVVFAVDSIPAVFGVTVDPFIVYTSNLFAIFSLRALYGRYFQQRVRDYAGVNSATACRKIDEGIICTW